MERKKSELKIATYLNIFVAVLLRGYRIWPGIFLGAFAGNIWAYIDLASFSNISKCLFTGTANGIGDVLALGLQIPTNSDAFLNAFVQRQAASGANLALKPQRNGNAETSRNALTLARLDRRHLLDGGVHRRGDRRR